MSNDQGKVSQSVREDFRSTSRERWGGDRQRERERRREEHRQGVDHGKGCVHCDVTFGR